MMRRNTSAVELVHMLSHFIESQFRLKPISHKAVHIKFDVMQNVAASQQIQYSFIYSSCMCTS